MSSKITSRIYKVGIIDLLRAYNKYVIEGDPTKCWDWLGSKSDAGYGTYGFSVGTVKASHISYTINIGRIPDGLQVNHKCNNRLCVNPNHLYAGTQAENVRDITDSNRWNPFRLITIEDEIAIIDMRLRGVSIPMIADKFGYDVKTVGSLLYRRQIYVNNYVSEDIIKQISLLRQAGYSFKDISVKVGRSLGSVKACYYRRGTQNSNSN